MIDPSGRWYRAFVVLAVVPAVLGGCAAAGPGAGRAAPDPDRPVVDAALDLAPDLGSATGTQSVRFTPDDRTCELVFRLWANRPPTVADGTSSEITRAAVDGIPVTPVTEQAGAPEGAPGTLVELPLPACVDAGTPVTAELGFRITLGADSGQRIGRSPAAGTAWLGSPLPLLDHVRGRGWVRGDAVPLAGETVVSEDFRLASLAVTVDDDQQVVGVGTPAGRTAAGPGRNTHTFTADAIRDVAIAAGDYTITGSTVGTTRVRVALPAPGGPGVTDGTGGLRGTAADWTAAVAEYLPRLEALLGPHPYPDLWLTIVPTQSDGVEFPTHLQFGDVDDDTRSALTAHELAHMWFYALVGNDQGRDPWLDESFATWAQAVVADQAGYYRPERYSPAADGRIGDPMTAWDRRGGGFSGYVTGVYDQGAAALLEGRRRVGADRFDAAVRDHIDRNAHRVVEPADVRESFAGLPEVLEVLREHGAFDGR
ncbi:M1 family metallopeptidase [Pseudonocardia kongjuensis]|uniref:M1 family metallopeptidase n=1 Tax=Pseudonocardia kongjuensis TaxID=102227 RepID=A0ABN1XGU5_9PSEU